MGIEWEHGENNIMEYWEPQHEHVLPNGDEMSMKIIHSFHPNWIDRFRLVMSIESRGFAWRSECSSLQIAKNIAEKVFKFVAITTSKERQA